jgi:hypothetical protein
VRVLAERVNDNLSVPYLNTGLAISESGKLAGPWLQQQEPIYREDGGHPMLFRTFEGELMMALHSPNQGPNQRIHLFEMEDTGETLRVVRRFTGR